MEIAEASKLISPGLPDHVQHSVWADLGCGSGVFTHALAKALGSGNKIFAVDRQKSLVNLQVMYAEIEFIKADFERDELPFVNLQGIVMANSLHYIKDKPALLNKLRNHLTPDGQWIIVEYDTEKANPWVPYPITFNQLATLFAEQGFNDVRKIGERNSIYGSDKMYGCMIKS